MLKHLQSRADWNEKTIGEKGFTLIELLVVIIILGILAAVAIFAIGNIQDNANEAACETERNIVRTAVAAWVSENPTENEAADAQYDQIAPYIDGGLDSLSQNANTPPSGEVNIDSHYDCATP